ncbi:hypothetical protein [Staphylococcus gallinarum]|nr:hypothetical protein [Staphylococcus gallinarum]
MNSEDITTYYELPHFIVDPEEPSYKISFKGICLYFHIYNKDLDKNTKKHDSEDGNSYFQLTIKEITNLLNVSENTARKYKNELVKAGLIIEKSSKGKKANSYAVNKDLDLKKQSSTYTDKKGNQRFTFYKVPDFLYHSYFKENGQCGLFIFSFMIHRMNLSINNAHKGKYDFVDKGGRAYCKYSVDELLEKLNLNDKNVIKKAKDCLIETGLLQEITMYDKNKKTTSIQFYPQVPIALPVENQKEYTLLFRDSVKGKKVLYTKENHLKKKDLESNKLTSTPYQNDSNTSKNNVNVVDTPQKSTTRDLELRELLKELLNKYMKHMYKMLNVSNVQHSNNVINLNTKNKRTRIYPQALAAHINKYSDKDINSFCDVINKGKDNQNRALNTNYTIEDVERALIEAVEDTVAISEKENKTQDEKERYLMGAVKNVFEQHHKLVTQPNDINNEVTNRYTANRNQSREMTPKWLLKRDQPKVPEKTEPEEDEKLKADREAFLKHLQKQWGEDEAKCAN